MEEDPTPAAANLSRKKATLSQPTKKLVIKLNKDLLALGLAVTNLLTGFVWLSIRPKFITPVQHKGVECKVVESDLPPSIVSELLWQCSVLFLITIALQCSVSCLITIASKMTVP